MRKKKEDRISYFPWDMKEQLLGDTDGRCAHCGKPLDRYADLTVDHFIPLGKGGTNGISNLTVLCGDCNREKSDMVLSPGWYPFLSKARKKALTEKMKEYMRQTDYLSEDCLMPLDSFRIEVPVTTRKNMGRVTREIRMPAYITGIRMEMPDAFSWLMEYRKSLLYRDAQGTVSSPKDFRAPCYLLRKGDIEVAMANPWMIHEYDPGIGAYRNEIIVDWFFSPGLPERDYLPDMLFCMVLGLDAYIQRSISGSMEGACMVLFRTRCFLSDRFCKPVFDRLAERCSDRIVEFGTGYSLDARLREASMFSIMGERKACLALQKKMEGEHPDGYLDMAHAMKDNNTFNRRFEEG